MKIHAITISHLGVWDGLTACSQLPVWDPPGHPLKKNSQIMALTCADLSSCSPYHLERYPVIPEIPSQSLHGETSFPLWFPIFCPLLLQLWPLWPLFSSQDPPKTLLHPGSLCLLLPPARIAAPWVIHCLLSSFFSRNLLALLVHLFKVPALSTTILNLIFFSS